MIPVEEYDASDYEDEEGFEIESEPSLTYKLDFENKIVQTVMVDEKEALKQAIYKILHTERYAYDMYDWDYGIEMADYIGQDIDEVLPDIQNAIEDALTTDDRIESVDYIEVEQEKGKLYISMLINSIYGLIEIETEVEINV